MGTGDPPAGSRGGAPVGVWCEAPEDIQKVCSCQMLFYAGLLPSPSSISPDSPFFPTPKKTPLMILICANPMTQHGHGRPVPTVLFDSNNSDNALCYRCRHNATTEERPGLYDRTQEPALARCHAPGNNQT